MCIYIMKDKLWNNSQLKFAPAYDHAASRTKLLYFMIYMAFSQKLYAKQCNISAIDKNEKKG